MSEDENDSINNIDESNNIKNDSIDQNSEEDPKNSFDNENSHDLENENNIESNNEDNSDHQKNDQEENQNEQIESKENNKIEMNKEDFNNKNPYEIKNDDDVSISSNSENNENKNLAIEDAENQEYKDTNQKSLFEQRPFMERYLLSIISSIITLLIIIANIIICFVIKSNIRMHIIPKTLEIVNKIGGYVIWSLHCLGLLSLPFLVVKLFEKRVKIYQIFLPPIMMAFNLVGGIVPIKWSCFPLIIELLISIFYIFHLPLDTVYIPKKPKFWQGEITLMFLGFIYISSALGASTLSYMMYGSYIRVNSFFSSYPSNPHFAIEFVKYLKSMPNNKVLGEYLACYSLFTFLSVGIGFVMSLKNSILMIVPFACLSICTIIETKAIGTLLFCQLLIHVIYITCLHFSKTRYLESGKCWECLRNFKYVQLMIIIVGDIIAFLLVVFPILHLAIYKDGNKKFHWGYYFAGAIVMTIAIFCNCGAFWDSFWSMFFTPLFYLGASCIFGMLFAGYIPLIRLFTFEITYLSWSLYLYFWCFSQGYSPTLLKIYCFLIPISSCVMIELYEGIGWMEILSAAIQIPIDTFFIFYCDDLDCKYLAWPLFAASGLVILSGMISVPILIAGILICLCLGSSADKIKDAGKKIGDGVGNMFRDIQRGMAVEEARRQVQTNPNLTNGSTIYAYGHEFTVTKY